MSPTQGELHAFTFSMGKGDTAALFLLGSHTNAWTTPGITENQASR